MKIRDIRPAPVNESVTKYFMTTLKTYSYVPQLVYHGTQMKSIKSILHYGLLVPCKETPIISGAPVIHSRIGQAYGVGIYCSLNVLVSLTYTSDTNTLLICAALPKRRKHGVIDGCYGDVLVSKEESRIIPLFLLDVKYHDQNHMNHPWSNDGEKKIIQYLMIYIEDSMIETTNLHRKSHVTKLSVSTIIR